MPTRSRAAAWGQPCSGCRAGVFVTVTARTCCCRPSSTITRARLPEPGLPTLVLVQRDVLRRVVFDGSFGGYVGQFPADAGVGWLHTDEFLVPFKYWTDQLRERRDIFLGYCSSSASTAAQIKRYLASQNASVLDWQSDFIPGRTIIDQIEEAASRSIAGIFLFTKDDDLANPSEAHQSVPRDNVVFEAGYFSGLKGKRNVLIVREAGSKMPATSEATFTRR